MESIFKRSIVEEIGKYLDTDDLLVLHGARQVGKTSILYYLQNQLNDRGIITHFVDLEDSRFVKILDAGVGEFLKYLREEGVFADSRQERIVVFIDEIQYLADPSQFLKLVADHHKAIKLIVSGSSSFAIKSKFTDSLVGRTVNFEIFTLSFKEFLFFNMKKEVIGNVFETGIFAELVKKYSQDAIFYWRTKDRKEIDFILRIRNDILPIEVKLNFEQYNPLAIQYFNRHYGLNDYRVVSLNGERKNEFCIYPWTL